MEPTIRIGELATRAGVSVRSLRYYEEQGLLTSLRSPRSHRRSGVSGPHLSSGAKPGSVSADAVDRALDCLVPPVSAAARQHPARTAVDRRALAGRPGAGGRAVAPHGKFRGFRKRRSVGFANGVVVFPAVSPSAQMRENPGSGSSDVPNVSDDPALRAQVERARTFVYQLTRALK